MICRKFLDFRKWTRHHRVAWLILRLPTLCFLSIVFSATLAQWWHEFGHIVIALTAGAPVNEYAFWPPWQQYVTADFSSKSLLSLNLFIAGGFLMTIIPLSMLFTVLTFKKSNWAYVLLFSLFQTLPTSSGDLGALGIVISPEINGFVGWTMPLVAFVLLTLFYLKAELHPTQKSQSSTTTDTQNTQFSKRERGSPVL